MALLKSEDKHNFETHSSRVESCLDDSLKQGLIETTPLTRGFMFEDRMKHPILSDYTPHAWIIKNQFGRRNINNATRALLALELEPLIREKAKEKQATSSGGSNPQLLPNLTKAVAPIDTRKEISKIAGVSSGTIHEAKKVKESGNEEVIDKMKTGTMSIF